MCCMLTKLGQESAELGPKRGAALTEVRSRRFVHGAHTEVRSPRCAHVALTEVRSRWWGACSVRRLLGRHGESTDPPKHGHALPRARDIEARAEQGG